MFRMLSFPLTEHAATWPDNPPSAKATPTSLISKGDIANTTLIQIFSHSGSHFDAPKHFNDAGFSTYQLKIDECIFYKTVVVDAPKPNGGAVTKADVEPYAEQIASADLVLIRTGWTDIRASDPVRYGAKGPYFLPELARYLMEFPKLRGVGIDAVSIACPDYFDESVQSHQALTGYQRTDGRYVLILEDLRIDLDLGNAKRIYAIPLMIEGSDGSPCTIFAEF